MILNFEEKIKYYNDFDYSNENYKIGIIINESKPFSNHALSRVVYPFIFLDDNFDFYIISKEYIDDFIKDLKNDICFFDTLIIKNSNFSYEFSSTVTYKCKICGTKLIYEINEKQSIDNLFSKKESPNIILIKHADLCITSDVLSYNSLILLNKNSEVIPMLNVSSNKLEYSILKDMYDGLNIISLWDKFINSNSRDKKAVLYEVYSSFLLEKQINLNLSFFEFVKLNSYQILKNSSLFDSNWYLNEYDDVKVLNLNPIEHYLSLGYAESCNPSKFFNSDEFLKKHPYIKSLNINPLVFYILYGNSFMYDYGIKDFDLTYDLINHSTFFDGEEYLNHNVDVKNFNKDPITHYIKDGYNEKNRLPNFSKEYYEDNYLIGENVNPLIHYISVENTFLKRNRFDFSYSPLNESACKDISSALNRNISVVVVVFNIGLEIIKKCVNSLLCNKMNLDIFFILPSNCRNDVLSYLKKIEYNNDNIKLKFNEYDISILDYVGALISKLGTDVLLLNDFTELTYNSIESMLIKAYSSEEIGCVTPFSNSIYNAFSHNNINDSFSITPEGYSTILKKYSDYYTCRLSSFDGYCTFIKKDAIFKIDWFNSSYCFNDIDEKIELKLVYEDFLHVLDDCSYVHHNEGFYKNNFHFINQIDFVKKLTFWEEVTHSKSIKKIANNLELLCLEENPDKFLSTILYITNDENRIISNDFINYYTRNNYEIYYLTSDLNKITLWKDNEVINAWTNSKYEEEKYVAYFEIFSSLDINLICIDSLLNHNPNILDLIKTFKLGIISDIKSQDIFSSSSHQEFNGKDIEKWMNDSNRIICYNSNLKEYCMTNFNLPDEKITVIGDVDLDLFNIKPINKFSDLIRIVVLGNTLDENMIKNIKEFDEENKIEFHFIGDLPESFEKLGVCHGCFNENIFENVLYKLKMNYIAIFDFDSELYELINYIPKEIVPLIISNNDSLTDFFEGYDELRILPSSIPKEIYNFIIKLSNEEYEDILKEKYYSNEGIKNQLKHINYIYDDMFYNSIPKKQKIISNDLEYISGYENSLKFVDMDDFLIKSFFSPYVLYPFSNEDKRCFAFMDHLSKKLMMNVEGMEKLVSIIMPSFNNENTIRQSIQSVLNQSYSNFELIIVDDGSSDDTLDIINEFDDRRIKLFCNECNKGVSYSRNIGLKKSNGDYIAYLDSDNQWNSNYLETVLGAFIELPNADALYSGQYVYENDDKLLAIKFSTFNKSLLHNKNFIDLSCFCHKKSILGEVGGFDEELKCMVDWDFILKVSNSFKIFSIPVLISKTFVNNNPQKLKNTVPVNTIYKQKIVEKNEPKLNSLGLSRPVSVIIPSFNSSYDLQQCINSILSHNSQDMIKIIVVDNNSNPVVKDYLKYLVQKGSIDLILNDINYAFTYAVNQGIAVSDKNSDILLLNNDAILTHNSIEYLQKYAYSIPDCGITVPQQILISGVSNINPHIPFADSELDCDAMISLANDNVHKIPIFNDGELVELNFAPFFCTYIKRSVLDESMLLDAELGRHHRSDRIFSNFVRQILNLKIYYVYDSFVYHKFQRATKKLRGQKDYVNIVIKNRWEPELAKRLNYSLPLWDYEME